MRTRSKVIPILRVAAVSFAVLGCNHDALEGPRDMVGLLDMARSISVSDMARPSLPDLSIVFPAPKCDFMMLQSTVPALGSVQAPVKMFSFEDFQGPFDAKYETTVFPMIKSQYVDNGKAQVLHIDFPLPSIHPNSMAGAIAARAANEFGKFWEMNDLLYVKQVEWTPLDSVSLRAKFIAYAQSLGIDGNQYGTKLDDLSLLNSINGDVQKSVACGVVGVPEFFLVIPKGRISGDDLKNTLDKLTLKYNNNGMPILFVFQTQDQYVVNIPGAFPYEVYDAFLSKVNYQ